MGGWVGGWGETKNKANLSPTELPAELELGLSLAKISSRGAARRWLQLCIASLVLMMMITIQRLEIGREDNEEINLNNEVRDHFRMKRPNNMFVCLIENVGS